MLPFPLRRDHFVGSAIRLSALEAAHCRNDAALREHVVRSLHDSLAETITRAKLQVRELEHGEREYRIEVMVVTPHELCMLVDERARELALRMPRPETWADLQPPSMNDADPRRAV